MDYPKLDDNFHSISLQNVASALDTHVELGLDEKEVIRRISQYGSNTIAKEQKRNPFVLFLKQFNSPIVYLLLFAATMSFIFKEWLDGAAIIVVIFLNAIIGFYMEFKAQRSMQALMKMSLVPAKVLRNGQLTEVNAERIVPGDILYVEAGDMITADGKLFKASRLLIDESALTGESLPIEKKEGDLPVNTMLADRMNMAYKGTYVSKGNSHLLVCKTGMHTELGKIAVMVKTSDQTATPLEKKLEKFSKTLIKITVGLVVVIFFAGLLNGQPMVEMFETAIALAVAAIPEGLPIVATLSLAQGMLKMAKRNVIVKKLSAVETLGGTNVICTDKTGTLTQNKMEVSIVSGAFGTWDHDAIFHNNHAAFDLIIKVAVLCNTATLDVTNEDSPHTGDPLEVALLKFAHRHSINIGKLRNEYIKLKEEPFSSETRIMSTTHRHGDDYHIFAKGAIEELIKRCSYIYEDNVKPISEEAIGYWLAKAEETASTGQRLIALAYKRSGSLDDDLPADLIFLGMIGLADPPRPEVFSAIKDCKTAGIKVVMITGDHPSTACYIGAQLGITDAYSSVIVGRNMKDYEELTEVEKQDWIKASIFARVNPKNKLDLVKVYQEKNYVVGMTGDGINDAPALRKADIGISMGLRGTQVAQEVSDMVLKDDSFSSIVIAVKQGRVIFENIKKFVTFLLSCNLSELLVIAVVSILNLHFQLFPLQILFINLITDVLPALALGVTKGNKNIMKIKPRNASEPILNTRQWRQVIFYSAIISVNCIGTVYLYHFIFHKQEPLDTIACNNILFFTLIITQLLHVFNMGKGSFFKTEVIKNRFVWYAVIASVAILIGAIQINLVRQALDIITISWQEWVIILLSGLCTMILLQIPRLKAD